MSPSSDEMLYAAYVQKGDVVAFSALVERYAVRLAAFLGGLLPPADVEDAVQDTWTRLIEKAASYRGGVFGSYLFVIARRVAIDRLRRMRPTVPLAGEGADADSACTIADAASTPDKTLAENDLKKAIRETIRALPDGPRQVVLLRIEGEMPFKAIADELGVPLGTALNWMHVATARLRERMGECHV